MRKRLGLSLALLLLCAQVAQAQIPVTDAGNLVQNTISAIQDTVAAIEAVFQSAQTVLELTPLDDIGVSGDITDDMAQLKQLVEQADGLSYDVGSLRAQIIALFDLNAAPSTRDGLTARLAEIKRMKFASYSYAARVQTLMSTALRTVHHLGQLLDTLAGLVGNMQGNQTVGQFQAVTAKHVTNLDVQMAAFYRAETVDKLSDALIIESLNRIQARRMEDWPAF